ncbi:MAG TPA: hypothetical protein VGL58_11200 [Caulobacteraceae bacterium]|jgi:hypothetical protein
MFAGWENFYFMLGSAAAALIGLLFIVVTLTAGSERSSSLRGQSIYLTPQAVHFGVVVALSAIAIAPQQGRLIPTAMFALGDLVGLGNAIRTGVGVRGLRRTAADPPHWTDMWAYALIPGGVYAGLTAAIAGMGLGWAWGVKLAGVALLGLLLIGIRNAWDLVTWLAARPTPQIGPPP